MVCSRVSERYVVKRDRRCFRQFEHRGVLCRSHDRRRIKDLKEALYVQTCFENMVHITKQPAQTILKVAHNLRVEADVADRDSPGKREHDDVDFYADKDDSRKRVEN